jgi:hypothetical protein
VRRPEAVPEGGATSRAAARRGDTRARRLDARFWSWLPLAALVACGSHPSQGDCERIAEHMIQIFTAPRVADDGKVAKEVQSATDLWRKNLLEKDRDPTRTTLIEVCRTDFGRGATGCILDAQDEAALARCFGG